MILFDPDAHFVHLMRPGTIPGGDRADDLAGRKIQELEEPPGAELLDMDAVLREIGYEVTAGRSFRAYHHKGVELYRDAED